jgi:hypothetical protein
MRRLTALPLAFLVATLVSCGGGDSDGGSSGESGGSSDTATERALIVSEVTAWIQTIDDITIADPAALESCVKGYIDELSDDDALIIAANVAASFAGLDTGDIVDWEALGVSEDGRYSFAGAGLCWQG